MAKEKRFSYEVRKDYLSEYSKKHYKQIKFDLNIDTESDILEKLDSVDNKRQYIINLIRADISKEKTRE